MVNESTGEAPQNGGCPDCGCPGSDLISEVNAFGGVRRRLRCWICGREWTQLRRTPPKPQPKEVLVRARCKCGGQGRVTTTDKARGLRYFRCTACGNTWKLTIADPE